MVILLGIPAIVYAPGRESTRLYVRITAYSCKQYKESSLVATGKSARNEKGCAVSRHLKKKYGIKYGDRIRFSDTGEVRIVDDVMSRWAEKKFKGMLVDRRYYQSLNSKQNIKKQLYRKDCGWDYIEVLD